MDPMSLISSGMGAAQAGLAAFTGGANALNAVFGLFEKIFSTLEASIQQPQQQQAEQTTEQSTQGWPQDQRDYAMSATNQVFPGLEAPAA